MKSIAVSTVIALLLIVGSFFLAKDGSFSSGEILENVNIIDGVQFVDIRARGGYSPKKSVAQSGLPTIIRFDGEGTFDCSVAMRIPSLDIEEFLSFSEKTNVDIGIPKSGKLYGGCSMGMYFFEIEFI